MSSAVETFYALDTDVGCASALNPRAHLIQQIGQVGDFGLASAILHDGFAVGERSCHQQVFGAGDGDFVESNFGPAQALGGGFDVTMLLRDLGAKTFESPDMKINGPGADSASAGKGDAGPPASRDQWAQDESRGTHGLD